MQVFYHPKKSCCLHGTMCLFLIMIYPPNVILIKKERKEKKITHSLFNTGHLEVKFNSNKVEL